MPSPNSDPQQSNATKSAQHKSAYLAIAIAPARPPKLSLGQIVITSNAQSVLTTEDVTSALRRHAYGDWGTVCAEDWKANNLSCLELGMVLSAYDSEKGTRFWIISDPGHEVTTVMLPEDH